MNPIKPDLSAINNCGAVVVHTLRALADALEACCASATGCCPTATNQTPST